MQQKSTDNIRFIPGFAIWLLISLILLKNTPENLYNEALKGIEGYLKKYHPNKYRKCRKFIAPYWNKWINMTGNDIFPTNQRIKFPSQTEYAVSLVWSGLTLSIIQCIQYLGNEIDGKLSTGFELGLAYPKTSVSTASVVVGCAGMLVYMNKNKILASANSAFQKTKNKAYLLGIIGFFGIHYGLKLWQSGDQTIENMSNKNLLTKILLIPCSVLLYCSAMLPLLFIGGSALGLSIHILTAEKPKPPSVWARLLINTHNIFANVFNPIKFLRPRNRLITTTPPQLNR